MEVTSHFCTSLLVIESALLSVGDHRRDEPRWWASRRRVSLSSSREANDGNSASRGPKGLLCTRSIVRTPCILLIYLFVWLCPGKPNLPLGLRGKAGGCARVTAGPKRPHLGVCPGPTLPLQGRQGPRGCRGVPLDLFKRKTFHADLKWETTEMS